MNRLAEAPSLYLRQHADNPVDWYPWGEDAFARARAEDKPVLLSIGYSACHWCHVMAHESFAAPGIAAVMNRYFVSIKVDREERPDVDAVYMEAVQAMTGHGGWPLTVFLTPDGRPFYGGTYFPPAPRQGMPGFVQVLEAVADAWRTRRTEVEAGGARLVAALDQAGASAVGGADLPGAPLVARAAATLTSHADMRHGGLGGAPKFPQAPSLSFLLRHGVLTTAPVDHQHGQAEGLAAGSAAGLREAVSAQGDGHQSLQAVLAALAGMATGGIHDQLAGGFHRYSTDAAWTVPHFEKMLYDNALLARLYVEGWQVFGVERLRQVALATCDYLLRELRDEHGTFAAATDADSDGVEGAYFVWRAEEFDAALTPDVAAVARAWYGVTDSGNFEGANVLTERRDPSDVTADGDLDEAALGTALARARCLLLQARARRPAPVRDPKVVVAWNGLAIDALAYAGAVFGRQDYVAAARAAAKFIRSELHVRDELAHMWTDQGPSVPAFLDDFGAMASAALTVYEATSDPEWAHWAEELGTRMTQRFADDGGGPYFRTSADHGRLVLRQRDIVDSATPSGNALAVRALMRLASLTGEERWRTSARSIVAGAAPLLERSPAAAASLLGGLAGLVDGAREVAIAGDPNDVATAAMAQAAWRPFLPWTVRAVGAPGSVPLLVDRTLRGGHATAYVCRGWSCRAPVTTVAELAQQLGYEPDAPPGSAAGRAVAEAVPLPTSPH